MKRVRGSGGRFLNTKQLQQQQNAESSGNTSCPTVSGSKVSSENGPFGSSVTSNASSSTMLSTSGSMTVEQNQFGLSSSAGDGRGSMMSNCYEYGYP